jgi:ketosteroid isomerase-like protein
VADEASREATQLNERALRRFYAAFERDDYAKHVRGCLTDDAIWHITGNHRLAGDVVGADAIVRRILDFETASNGTLRLQTTITATPTHAVAIHDATATRPGTQYSAHEIDVFHFRDGLVSEFWSFSEDQEATDRLWC